MKRQLLIILWLGITISQLAAQKKSCDIAYRFDASYTKTYDQLDDVTLSLNLAQTSKGATSGTKETLSGNFYYVSGTAATKKFLSADANIGFMRCFVLQPNLELYKADVKNGMRTFTIPAGSNGSSSVNISIQVMTPPGTMNNGMVNWGPGNFKIKFINGYLASGEYILIDKNSMSSNGSQIKGYAFSIQ